MRKQALGRGLSALLNDPKEEINTALDKNADKIVGTIIDLKLENISINPFQPRTSFNEEALNELASSIKELGVIQPITVRKLDGNKFQLVSGERRFRASKIVGLKTIPAYVRLANDQESLEMALVENIQRQDLDPIEVALSYERLINEIELTHEALSERVGKNRSTISNYLRLLKLDPIIQTGMRDGFISMGHGRALINIENTEEQLDIYQKIIQGSLSVRQTEDLVRAKRNPTAKPKKREANIPSFAKVAKKELSTFLDSTISIKSNTKGKGHFTVAFKNEEELNRIINIIKRGI